jgi:hypothetical protein
MEERNIEHAFAYARSIVDDPTLLDEIPDGAAVVLIPRDDPELVKASIEQAVKLVQAGMTVLLKGV